MTLLENLVKCEGTRIDTPADVLFLAAHTAFVSRGFFPLKKDESGEYSQDHELASAGSCGGVAMNILPHDWHDGALLGCYSICYGGQMRVKEGMTTANQGRRADGSGRVQSPPSAVERSVVHMKATTIGDTLVVHAADSSASGTMFSYDIKLKDVLDPTKGTPLAMGSRFTALDDDATDKCGLRALEVFKPLDNVMRHVIDKVVYPLTGDARRTSEQPAAPEDIGAMRGTSTDLRGKDPTTTPTLRAPSSLHVGRHDPIFGGTGNIGGIRRDPVDGFGVGEPDDDHLVHPLVHPLRGPTTAGQGHHGMPPFF